MDGVIYNRCGHMDVLPTDDPDVREAQILHTDIKIILDGARYAGWLRFPTTLIKKNGILRWLVDPCRADGEIEGHGPIWVNLLAERVIGPEALPVQGTGKCYFNNGDVGIVNLEYSTVLATPEGDGDWLVGPVNAKGTITV